MCGLGVGDCLEDETLALNYDFFFSSHDYISPLIRRHKEFYGRNFTLEDSENEGKWRRTSLTERTLLLSRICLTKNIVLNGCE